MKTLVSTLVVTTLLIAMPVVAQHQGHQTPANNPHAGHTMPGMKPQSAMPVNEASKAFMEANARMHKDMTIVFSGNADIDFAKGMIPHHQGAIDMSNIVLKHGKDAAVRKLANDIMAAQKIEITQMSAWLVKNDNQSPGSNAAAAAKAFNEVNAKMHADMTMSFTGNADIDFMKGMIPHHEGAVAMAKVLLQLGQDAELRKLADDVVRTQNEEITMMRAWLQKAGA
jgi:uncharacterized protein (DUF305 family)